MKWRNCKDELPEPHSGSYLIINYFGDIAEAEYRDDEWFQYKWSTCLDNYHVLAWCSLKDVELPDYISNRK